MRLYVPWRVRKFCSDAVSRVFHARNRWRHRHPAPAAPDRLRMLFCIPFYGYTGGSAAVLATATLLSECCDVAFFTTPTNVMNRHAGPRVRMVGDLDGRYDICVIESTEDPDAVARLRRNGARIVMTSHGDPAAPDGTQNHGSSPARIRAMCGLIDSIHIISETQAPILALCPGVHHGRVPNQVPRIVKTRHTRAAGIVGDTTLPRKNVAGSLAAAEASRAERIEIWGRNAARAGGARVHWNGFSTDKQAIYDSFDVLVHLAVLETQPLVVLEALGAGIPSVLADLPNYRFLHGLPGIWVVDPADRAAATAAIDAALDCPPDIRAGLVSFWAAHHAPDAIRQRWLAYLAEVMALPAHAEAAG